MKTMATLCLFLLSLATAASGDGILAPTGAGSCTGYTFPLQYAFDGQPTWNGSAPVGTGGGAQGAPNYSNRYGYIDFGADWTKVRINQTWTLYYAYSPGNHSGYASMWWDDDKDSTNDNGVAENTLKFNSAQGVANVSTRLWIRDVNCGTPVTPQRRYLILKSAAAMTTRAVEYTIVGYVQNNNPPTASAGVDATITLPATASLDGTVSDDGLPTPPGSLTTTWTKQAGPGTVTFGNASAVDTTATFSAAGVYVLRLTASDSEFSAQDDVVITVNGAASAVGMIAPAGAGPATGFVFPLQDAFNAPPTWDSQNNKPVGTDSGNAAPYYNDRCGYIDLGANWANLRITQAWTLYRSWSPGNQSGYASLWWDDDIDGLNDEGLTESTLNFNHGQGLSNISTQQWVRDADATSAPVAPLGRYLVLRSATSMTTRAMEYGIVGYSVSPTKTVLSPSGAGSVAGYSLPVQNAFDSQPYWDTQNAQAAGGGAGASAPSTACSYGYIDFGPDYRKVRITEAWTSYLAHSTGNQSGFAEMWWDNDTDDWNDGVTETTLNFNSAQGLSDSGSTQWVRDAQVSDAQAIIPAGRYLILKTESGHTARAAEFALVGWTSDVSMPEPNLGPPASILTLPEPQVFDYQQLTLVDEVVCGDPAEGHTLYESASGVSEIQTILGDQCRVIPNQTQEPKYFGYRIGENCGLEAGKAYVLVVEYPEDGSRSMVVVNHGCETNQGFHTGRTTGDCVTPPYVESNAESMNYGFTGEYRTWQQLFHLHDRFPEIQRDRLDEVRPYLPEDGFYVLIGQWPTAQDPLSKGAAVRRIALYEAPPLETYTQPLAELPAGLPKRHLFWREEMADIVIMNTDPTMRGVAADVDWFEYKARLYKFLGMNTFCTDLLEFGHCQGWDVSKYGGHDSDWFNRSSYPFRWEEILVMLAQGGYGLDVLPYYEYAGGDGVGDAALGKKKRARPLGDVNADGQYTTADPYTHISWSENLDVDVTDPDAITDAERLLEVTITDLCQGNRPISIPAANGGLQTWTQGGWGYLDLGSNWANIRITQTWTRSDMWHGGPASPYQKVYWHSNYTDFSGGNIPPSAIAENTINFITQPQINGQYVWTCDVDLAPASAITPRGRYLVMQAAGTLTMANEGLIVGWIEDGGTDDMQVITPAGAGAITNSHNPGLLFNNQPGFNFDGELNFLGAWIRTRPSAIPMGFADETRARYAADRGLGSVTRANLTGSPTLLADYYSWWYDQRKEYLNTLRDYLQTNVNPDAFILYTWDQTESGASHPDGQPDVITDGMSLWGDYTSNMMTYDDAVANDFHLEAMQLPVATWGSWEWPHSVPRGDGANYADNDSVMMAYVFNHLYTVAKPEWFDEYRSATGLAATRHYCLNEDSMTDSQANKLFGYFICDMEVAGPYCMLPDARAVAYGDPYYIGYLAANNFNRGFPGYAREFNSNFLALPALPMTTLTGATTTEGVVVRSITTQSEGTWLAIINTTMEDKAGVQVTLPVSGAVTDAVTGSAITVTGGKITLDLWPGRLKAVHIAN